MTQQKVLDNLCQEFPIENLVWCGVSERTANRVCVCVRPESPNLSVYSELIKDLLDFRLCNNSFWMEGGGGKHHQHH